MKLILHMADMLDLKSLCCLFFCSEVKSCSWLQKANRLPLGIWIISAASVVWLHLNGMTAVNPQTDWSLLLRFWTEVTMLEVAYWQLTKIRPFSPWNLRKKKNKKIRPGKLNPHPCCSRDATLPCSWFKVTFTATCFCLPICRVYIHKVQENGLMNLWLH